MNKNCFLLLMFLFSAPIFPEDVVFNLKKIGSQANCDHGNKIPKLTIDQRKYTKKVLTTKCDEQNGEACLALGMLFIFDEKNEKSGLSFFQKACGLGEKDGCFHYALKLTAFNLKKSKELLKTNCHFGHIKSCRRAAEIFQGQNDYSNAQEFYQIGCKNKDLKSCFQLAKMEKNIDERLKLLSLNCEKGHQLSCRVNKVLREKLTSNGGNGEKL